jgi:exopolyphosphatase/guanosine-5'-triphosphate,3'-diphosphate pyrophosphatase
MKTKRVAVIDLGTNTFHLLIAALHADTEPAILHQEKFIAKIGQGGISKGVLTAEAYQRTLGALQHFRKQIAAYEVELDNVYASATSAIRNAANGQQLVADIFSITGIQVRIISGEEEATYIYYGVKNAMSISQTTTMIMDIGGGSVEFILCNAEKIYWKQSFEIGGQRLLDRFMDTDPISMQAVQRLNDFLDQNLVPLTNAVHQYAPQVLIGASGAFETFCEIHYKKTNPAFTLSNQTAFDLPLDGFKQTYRELLRKDKTQRLSIPGMLEMRVDMIVVAACLVDYVLNKYNLSVMRVSAYALKEGVLFEQLKTENR